MELILTKKNKKKKYDRLKTQMEAYHKHLTEECGYELPYIRSGPMVEEFDVINNMTAFDEYEKEYKRLKLKGSIKIGNTTYDIRESEVNKLKIENNDLKHRLTDLEMQGFYIRRFLNSMSEKHSKILGNTWKEFAKEYSIEDTIPEWSNIRFDETISNEVDDVNILIKRAENRGKPISEKRRKELKKQAELQEKQNKLLDDFIEYQKHKRCNGSTCRKGADIKKCKSIRKKFRSCEDDKFLNEIPF